VKRATYRRAIQWLAGNDDNEWLRDERPGMSVTASLVADLWGKPEPTLRLDLLAELRHIHPRSWDRPMPWESPLTPGSTSS
jgi:hypothetical protein